MNKNRYTIVPFPKMRRLVTDIAQSAQGRFVMIGLLEMDVTRARVVLRAHREQTGENLSFTAFLIGCVAKAVSENKAVQAYKHWRGHLVQFEDVDVLAMVEVQAGGGIPVGHVVRAAQHKTLREIHAEIRSVQNKQARSDEAHLIERMVLIPRFLRRWLLWALMLNPVWVEPMRGTVVVTAVGMFGKGGGWGIGLSTHSLGVTVGGIAEKPGVVDGQIAIREYLCITLSFDHEIVDGAPAARFAARLRELIEGGYGLESLMPAPVPDGRTNAEAR